MKTVKRIFACLLAGLLALMMALPSMAAQETFQITITPNENDHATHTYEAYQIFSGDLHEQDGKKILSNIEWGNGVDGPALLAALKADATLGTAFQSCESASDVADVLQNFENDAADTQAFAKIVGANLSGVTSGTYSNQVISGLEAGYYLVKDADDSLQGEDDAAYTRYILGVVSDVTVKAKSEVPSVEKSITGENGAQLSASSASIGDQIPFTVSSKVPDMTGYNEYFFILDDTMSRGLTFNDDVAITVGDKTLQKDQDYTVSFQTNPDGTTSVRIVFVDFIQYQAPSYKDAPVTVTYSATLNQDADLTQAGNTNQVELIYSNDPNHTYTGDPQNPNEPSPTDPVGQTPASQTVTYSTSVKLTKVDADTNEALTGAKFEIRGTALKVVLINEEIYRVSDAGTYYMLKDSTYTQEAPTPETEDLYDSVTTRYEKVTQVTKDTVTEDICAAGYVDQNGVLTFEGLNAGEYTITELVSPAGYNLLSQPIRLVIESTPSLTGCAWSATIDGNAVSLSGDVISFAVENKSGTQLPSTGGIGTTIFYVVGVLLVVGAVAVFFTCRRGKEEKSQSEE